MTEPERSAVPCRKFAEGITRFRVHDDRIDSESDCYAIHTPEGTVLIDPLPLNEKILRHLDPIPAILLTARCHQRAAWRYRHRFGSTVYAPQGAEDEECEETPDVFYHDGQELPGGVEACHAPGPTDAHYAFLIKKDGGLLLCGDLLTRSRGLPQFIPGEYQDHPEQTRESVKKILSRKFKILCFNHGPPITSGAKKAIRKLLKKEVFSS